MANDQATAQPITPATWERMPWHPKAQAIAALDRELREAQAAIAAMRHRKQAAVLAYANLRTKLSEEALDALEVLAHMPPDPDGMAHMADLKRVLDTTCRAGECVREAGGTGYCGEHS